MFATRVQLPGGEALDLRTLYDDRHLRALKLAPFHLTPERVTCLCSASPLQLVVKRIDGDLRLACFPETTGRHDPRCHFYSPSVGPALTSYTLEAVKPIGDGEIYVRLAQTLDFSPADRDEIPDAEGGAPSRERVVGKRNTVRLVGLLELMWERACLNRRRPGDRCNYGHVADAITHAAGSIRIPAGHLVEHLYVPPCDWDEEGALLEKKFATVGRDQAVIVVGEFLSTKATAHSQRVSVKCLRNRSIFVPTEQWARAVESYGIPRRDDTHSTWIIAICLQPGKYATARQIGWIHCHRTIPVDSDLEVKVAMKLVAENRDFTKPVRFDRTKLDSPFPDFVLHDVPGGDYPMEVWGRSDPEYLARREVKRLEYGSRLWEWTPAGGVGDIPPLPPAQTAR